MWRTFGCSSARLIEAFPSTLRLGDSGETQRVMLGEVRCFPDRKRTTTETYLALGQYILYRAVLLEAGILTPLYLAVPQEVYDTIFVSTVQRAIRDNKIKLLIVNIDTETIVEWIE